MTIAVVILAAAIPGEGKAMFGCATCGRPFDSAAGDCPNPHHQIWPGAVSAPGGQCGAVLEIGGQPLPCQLRRGHAGEHRRRSDSGMGAATTEWEVRWAEPQTALAGAPPLTPAPVR